jgi:hypothetical protein
MSNAHKQPASPAEIDQALAFIPAHERETWLQCGMAIKAELGDAGFDIWDQWSRIADNYRGRDAPDVCVHSRAVASLSARCSITPACPAGIRLIGHP